MFLQEKESDCIIRVEVEETAKRLIEYGSHVELSPETMAKQLFRHLSDNEELTSDVQDFLTNPKRFVLHHIEDVFNYDLSLASLDKYLFLHQVEGALHLELMRRNLIKRGWIVNC